MKSKSFNQPLHFRRYVGKAATSGLLCLMLFSSVQTMYAGESGVANQQVTQQQGQIVTGTVTDAKGEPLVGVNVSVKGTTKGTITDINGKYSLQVPVPNATLVFSYIGYLPKTQAVGNARTLSVKLAEDTKVMDEVVVVGYGTQKKVTLAGAVSTLGEKTFSDRGVISNPVAAIQGQVPGMVVTRQSSAPGREDWSFKIRGQASVNDPGTLVLIDGIPGSIADVNPDDIDNISILKDAAAAIYGSRSAGGVVLVTTKRGKNQKTTVSYKGNVALKTPSMQQSFMNMQQWASSIEEAVLNDGTAPGSSIGAFPYWAIQAMKSNDPRYMGTVQNYLVGPNAGSIHNIGFLDIDMNKETWGNALSNSHSVSVAGGTEKNQYNISVGLMDDKSPLREKWGDDQSKRYNIRANNDIRIAKWFDLGTDLSFDRRSNVYPMQRPSAIAGNPPGSPLLTKGGNPFGWASNMTPVVAAKFGGQQTTNVNSFKVNIAPKFHLLKGLDLLGNVFFNPWDVNNMGYQNIVTWYDYDDVPYSYLSPNSSYVNREAKTVMKEQYQGYFNYKTQLKGIHSLDIMAGTSYEKEKATSFIAEKTGLLVPDLHSLNTGTTYSKATDAITSWAMASYFGRVNYTLKDRYILEALGRYDGSSRFITGKKWAPFYGLSAAWRLSEESFLKKLDIFDNLKIRGSYGTTGNQAGINLYDYIALLNMNTASGNTPNYPLFGSVAAPTLGQTITEKNMVSTDRSWEVITTANIGIDFALLKNRLSGSFDYFQKRNDGMLVNVTYPQTLGATAPQTNNGSMSVNGWEASLGWRDRIGKVNYYINANISDSRNKLITMQNATLKTWNARTTYLVNYPINTYWGMASDGLIKDADDLAAYKAIIGSDVISSSLLRIGDMKYKDLDGDGKVTKSDVKNLGDNTPHYSFGVNLGADYKGFDLSMIIQGVGKQTIIRNASAATMLVANTYQNQGTVWYGKNWSDIAEKYPNQQVTYIENDGSTTTTNLLLASVNKDPNAVPKTTNNGTIRTYNYLYSDAWFRKQNGAYARMKNITFGYTLPKTFVKKMSVEKLRVYFSGNDLFEITKTKDGWDPEATAEDPFGGTNGSNAYPFMRTYSFGLDLTF
ncbi:SusC/RagA family TonB-linked outer membrane protein [Parabacteroides sp. FAFU027]|uniref:SusC/RagA family TonB-linked outer membrane protein n=1 Tax=Parabacteroides sp. FAFU027 TaxID=2922715 RepID=UPI001FAF4C3A|nr:TonB-dependent receptor [Parabacteroides sp. FAFU027]